MPNFIYQIPGMLLSPDLRLSILDDHDRHPRHYGVPETVTLSSLSYNPRCGDKYTVYWAIDDRKFARLQFMGWGCAVSKASASMMCDALQGFTPEDALAFMQEFRRMLEGQQHQLNADEHPELFALEGIGENPLRMRCATLAWEALETGLREWLAKNS